mgnify:CR=1 FL=1
MNIDEMDALQFQQRFGTDDQCRDFLFKLRWPKGFVCPNCEHDDAQYLAPRRLYQCYNCKHQASVTSGTLFHRTHLPLRCWFWIIYQMTHDKGGVSATRLASQLNRPYKTIWHVLHKLRLAMGRRDEGITLAGLIEFDEAILGPEARRPTDSKPPLRELWWQICLAHITAFAGARACRGSSNMNGRRAGSAELRGIRPSSLQKIHRFSISKRFRRRC